MANEEQVAVLRQGANAWNRWRKKNPNAKIDFHSVNLSRAKPFSINLYGADLRGVDLRSANLSNTNLREANLTQANLAGANLSGANLEHAIITLADLQGANLAGACLHDVDFIESDLHGASFREGSLCGVLFRHANLSEADFRGADLGEADLRKANLRKADLRDTSLVETQVLGANFEQAILTGACIQSWQLDNSTVLKGVRCDYIFRTYKKGKYLGSVYNEREKFTDRLPVDFESTFVLGEFERWIRVRQSALDTIDVTFIEGIDWQAFFKALQEVRKCHPESGIRIQSVQEVDGTYVASLSLETEVEDESIDQLRAEIESKTKSFYERQLIEARAENRVLERSLDQAMEKLAMASTSNYSQNFHAPVGNVAQTNQGKMQNIQHIYAPEQQDLSEAAKEIQSLLSTLAKTYNTTTEAGQEKLMKELGQEIKQHPKWRRALKEGGIELIKVLCAPIGVPLEMARVYLEEE